MAKSPRTSVPDQIPSTPQPAAAPIAAAIPLAKHHMEMHNTFALGADCVNRVSTMIDAALEIARASTSTNCQSRLLVNFLKECQILSEDLAGLLESGSDEHLAFSADQERK